MSMQWKWKWNTLKLLVLFNLIFAFASTCPAEEEQGEKWAILIGIDKYDTNPLKYTVNDAKELYNVITRAPEGFKPDNVILMTPDAPKPVHRPTRNNIIAILNSWFSLPKNKNDMILFYYSGHGAEDKQKGKAYILPQDVIGTLALSMTAIDIEYIKNEMRKSEAQRRILILDSCHSGAEKATEAMGQGLAKSIDESKGLATLASCDIDEFSYEMDDTKHGAFTYFLMEALKGQADRDKNGELWAGEVNNYVWDKTRTWAAGNGKIQTPKYITTIGDPVLAKVETEPPKFEIIQPTEWRSSGTVLKFHPTLKTLHMVGLASDNTEVRDITINGQKVSFTAASPKNLRLIPLRGKTVEFETDISIEPETPIQNIVIRVYDAANNVAESSYQLQLQFPEITELLITVTPSDATVTLAPENDPNRFVQPEKHPRPPNSYQIEKGHYRLSAQRVGYATDSRELDLKQESETVEVKLERLMGTLDAQVTPADAADATVEITPLKVPAPDAEISTSKDRYIQLPIGTYRVTAKKVGYKSAVKEPVEITANASTPVRLTLIPVPLDPKELKEFDDYGNKLGKRLLYVGTGPGKLSIPEIEGITQYAMHFKERQMRQQALSSKEEKMLNYIDRLAEGLLSVEEYRTAQSRLYPGGLPKFDEDLTNGRGKLVVKTTPVGAAIYLDGLFIAYSPKEILNLSAGQWRIRLVWPGIPAYEQTVEIRDDETAKLSYPPTTPESR